MPPVASRTVRRIASKACDTCRLRKVQCIFDKDDASCRRCSERNFDCTFLTDRKQRGPTARRAVVPVTLPVGELSIDYLCAPGTFSTIIEDYLQLIFPVLPLIHRPTFLAKIEAKAYATDSAFLRLCLALCAATVASIPRKFDEYSQDRYPNAGAMVDRASHLVLLSRISAEPEWPNQASTGTMIVSTILTFASHYVGRGNQGWMYASEATQFFRALALYRKDSYEHLSLLDREMCKRCFWLLYIVQIHDRLASVVPHTGLSFEPLRTDWEFLLPLELGDEELEAGDQHEEQRTDPLFNPTSSDRPLPLISGFVALIKVFLCVVDLLSNGFPGSPPQGFAMTSGPFRASIYPNDPVDQTLAGSDRALAYSTISPSALLRIVEKLQNVLTELPRELSIPNAAPGTRVHFGHIYPLPVADQFEVMRANIHVTSLYLRSSILEACSNALTNPQADMIIDSLSNPAHMNMKEIPQRRLWAFRKSIASELLDLLKSCSSHILEANGASMIVKIRQIAATLLHDDDEITVTSEEEKQTQQYLAQFAEVLATLDYVGEVAVNPPIPSPQ